MITADQLHEILPYAGARVAQFLDPLNAAMTEFGISTPGRIAAFLGQVGHESGSLAYVREIANGQGYEGRRDLGNTHPGDGPRYRGRGLLQVTGRANYDKCGQALGLDLLARPELLEQPVNAARSAAWFWQAHGLNELADVGDIHQITQVVNGGHNGEAERLAIYRKALEVLQWNS